MIKIEDKRGTGKTTKLLKIAAEKGYILIEPTEVAVRYAIDLAKRLGIEGVQIISFYDYSKRTFHPFSHLSKDKYLIDELDWFLSQNNVVGYSNSIEESD